MNSYFITILENMIKSITLVRLKIISNNIIPTLEI